MIFFLIIYHKITTKENRILSFFSLSILYTMRLYDGEIYYICSADEQRARARPTSSLNEIANKRYERMGGEKHSCELYIYF